MLLTDALHGGGNAKVGGRAGSEAAAVEDEAGDGAGEAVCGGAIACGAVAGAGHTLGVVGVQVGV